MKTTNNRRAANLFAIFILAMCLVLIGMRSLLWKLPRQTPYFLFQLCTMTGSVTVEQQLQYLRICAIESSPGDRARIGSIAARLREIAIASPDEVLASTAMSDLVDLAKRSESTECWTAVGEIIKKSPHPSCVLAASMAMREHFKWDGAASNK